MTRLLADVLMPLAVILGGGWALWTYQKEARLKRAQWLHTLYASFFESDRFKRIRYILDYEPAEAQRLYDDLGSNEGDDLSEALVDYLNFFEFVCALESLGQLKQREIEMIFDYYLRLILQRPVVVKFVESDGFENLSEMLTRMGSESRIGKSGLE